MLDAAWHRCFEDMGGTRPPPSVFAQLQARYSEPQRAYHTLQHLDACFGWFAQARENLARSLAKLG